MFPPLNVLCPPYCPSCPAASSLVHLCRSWAECQNAVEGRKPWGRKGRGITSPREVLSYLSNHGPSQLLSTAIQAAPIRQDCPLESNDNDAKVIFSGTFRCADTIPTLQM